MNWNFNLYVVLTMLCSFSCVHSWDSNEMSLFDLVEEVNENFYGYLGLTQNASTSDIRRAYRRLSLKYHPDKNPKPEDAIKFRRIVGIYEILKDDKLRERYDEILKYGLPDWKMPVFYYRKLRKMSFIETFSLFFILATVIHYACLWGVYMEKQLNLNFLRSKSRKKIKSQERKNKKIGKSDDDSFLEDIIPTPTWKDILPFALIKLGYNMVIYTPSTMKLACDAMKHEVKTAVDKQFEQKRKAKELEEEKKRIEEDKRIRKERKLASTKEVREQKKLYEEAMKNSMLLPTESFTDVPEKIESAHDEIEFKQGKWTDEDTMMLIRALVKYPSGVKDRWEKISEFMKRPVQMITNNVREMQKKSEAGRIPINYSLQNTLGVGVDDQFNEDDDESSANRGDSYNESSDEYSGLSKKQRKKLMKKDKYMSSVPITKRDNGEHMDKDSDQEGNEEEKSEQIEDEEQVETITKQRKKARTKQKYLNGELSNQEVAGKNGSDNWSQQEQKQLEEAIRQFPKGTSERWDRISQKVPSKTKVQCIERIKKISEMVQKKNTTD